MRNWRPSRRDVRARIQNNAPARQVRPEPAARLSARPLADFLSGAPIKRRMGAGGTSAGRRQLLCQWPARLGKLHVQMSRLSYLD